MNAPLAQPRAEAWAGLDILWLDFETAYDRDYTLTRLTPPEYVLDARFEALGCAVIIGRDRPLWVAGPDLPAYFASVNWAGTYVVSHNMLFDGAVLKWRYGVLPAILGDSMARAWVAHCTGKVALAEVAQHYGLRPKGVAIEKLKGVSFAALKADAELYRETRAYAVHDAWLCREVFLRMLLEGFPKAQLELVDMVCRMAIEPKFVLNMSIARDYLAAVLAEKARLLAEAGATVGDVRSDVKFAALLVEAGLAEGAIPSKVSKQTGRTIFAFAKSDKPFTDLAQHLDPRVRALAAARIGVRSSLEETRAGRFLAVAGLPWRNERPFSMPIALQFSGARTHRLSGSWQMNAQNLRRGGRLRDALEAPPGMKVVSADASQIEARLVATLCGEHGLVEGFRAKRDVYADYASRLFGKPVTKETLPSERFCGKTSILSLGYSSGAETYGNMVRMQSEGEVVLTLDEARQHVDFYRHQHAGITAAWRRLDHFLFDMSRGKDFFWGPCHFQGCSVILPNAMRLNYDGLEYRLGKDNRKQWIYKWGETDTVIFGAKLLENVVQSLAFIVIMEAARRIKHESGEMPAHQVHDELLYVVDENIAEILSKYACQQIARPLPWLPGCPLAAEGKVGPSYGRMEPVAA